MGSWRNKLSRAAGVPIEDDLRPYRALVERVRTAGVPGKDEPGIRAEALRLRGLARAGDDVLIPGIALVCEACRRTLGVDAFDEQVIAGIAMHRGRLAQMQTGEGKTLAAVFPAVLAGLSGTAVHVWTANDYLAARDARWMGPVYEALGLRATFISDGMPAGARRDAYRADVTYLTAREAGFDYLRDSLCDRVEDLVQGELGMVLVDEADFLLVDEARVPLVIAGAAEREAVDLQRVRDLAQGLCAGRDYVVDPQTRRVSLLPPGHARIERDLGVPGVHEDAGRAAFARVYAALHARELLHRDVDYVVRDGRVEMVDGFTGRVAEKREWPWGVQAALEVKEGVAARPEGTVYGSVTIQSLVGLYHRVAAMTATAVPAAAELYDAYGLGVVVVPPVRPLRRDDASDAVFATRAERDRAVIREVTAAHAAGRPVLVGTGSIRESDELAAALRGDGVPCVVLNARENEREAELISAAGRAGAVTISTNMAGRGVDIRLDAAARSRGGLLVIGTNRHESRRMDDQLRGRAGRQGDPGASRFFVSLEDPLFTRYGVAEFLPRGRPLSDPRVIREIDRAQAIIEGQNHAIRRALRKYGRIVELERRAVRALHDDALLRERLPEALELACPRTARAPLVKAWLAGLSALWADHLLLVEEVREGIGLERYAGREPGIEYIRRIGSAFESTLGALVDRLCAACERYAAGDPDTLDPDRAGGARPSTTWTYQVDDESSVPFTLGAIAGPDFAAAVASGVLALLFAVRRLVRTYLRRGQRPGRS